MTGDGVDLSPLTDGSIVLSNQVVNKPPDFGAKGVPNHEINFYDYISQCNFFAFIGICENADGMRMNIISDLFFVIISKVTMLMV